MTTKRQRYISKISHTMVMMMGYIIYGKASKALSLVRYLERDLIELRKVEKTKLGRNVPRWRQTFARSTNLQRFSSVGVCTLV